MNTDTCQQLIQKTAEFMRQKFTGENTGHDWWHLYRVWKMAQHLCDEEKSADRTIVELAALLHDIADWKFNNGDEAAGPKAARDWLESQNVDSQTITKIEQIIYGITFKGADAKQPELSLEGQIVQDADRLDALGAVGIARAFAYGGYAGQEIYDPESPPARYDSVEAYKNRNTTTINHFYEKLLLLKDRMNTQAGRQIAEHRHQAMGQFLAEFYDEWEGKK